MFRLWKGSLALGFAPVMDAIDAGSGGGPVDPGDGGAGAPPADEGIDPAGDPAVAGVHADADDDDDDDDPDLSSPDPITPERFQRVVKKLSKLKRRDRTFATDRQRLKELKANGLSIDDLVTAHRNYQSLDQTIRSNKKLRATLYGEGEEQPATRAAEQPAAAETFDEGSLPFDANANPTNRYFADLAKQNFEMRQTMQRLEQGVQTREQREAGLRFEAEKSTWKNTIDAAATHIQDEGPRKLFKEVMTAAYRHETEKARSGSKLPRFTPRQVAEHYLKELGIDPAQAAKANLATAKVPAATPPARTAATQQKIAEQNKTLPRTVAPGGVPAPARSKVETLSDVRKRLTGARR